MSANNAVIHEHTVPVCYLANFGIHGNQGRRSILYYHNKLDGNSGVSGVVSFPVEKYFYDIENAREYEQIIEKFYAKVEGDLSLLLKAIINSVVIDPKSRKVPKVQLTSEQKDLISAHLAMLRTRTRAFRDFYKDIYLQLKNGFPFAQIPYYDEKDFKRLHFMEIANFKMSNFYANLVNDRNWAYLSGNFMMVFNGINNLSSYSLFCQTSRLIDISPSKQLAIFGIIYADSEPDAVPSRSGIDTSSVSCQKRGLCHE